MPSGGHIPYDLRRATSMDHNGHNRYRGFWLIYNWAESYPSLNSAWMGLTYILARLCI